MEILVREQQLECGATIGSNCKMYANANSISPEVEGQYNILSQYNNNYQAHVILSFSLWLFLILTYCFVALYVDVDTCCMSLHLSPQKLLMTRMTSLIQLSTELYLFFKPVISTASNGLFTQAPFVPFSVRMHCENVPWWQLLKSVGFSILVESKTMAERKRKRNDLGFSLSRQLFCLQDTLSFLKKST